MCPYILLCFCAREGMQGHKQSTEKHPQIGEELPWELRVVFVALIPSMQFLANVRIRLIIGMGDQSKANLLSCTITTYDWAWLARKQTQFSF
jgi:hypothetical protein